MIIFHHIFIFTIYKKITNKNLLIQKREKNIPLKK